MDDTYIISNNSNNNNSNGVEFKQVSRIFSFRWLGLPFSEEGSEGDMFGAIQERLAARRAECSWSYEVHRADGTDGYVESDIPPAIHGLFGNTTEDGFLAAEEKKAFATHVETQRADESRFESALHLLDDHHGKPSLVFYVVHKQNWMMLNNTNYIALLTKLTHTLLFVVNSRQ